ncbi:MAG: rhomboid family intramembrane serine protease [Hyphomonas sp.]|nr:rhomboid family intramembrane serine protease [Hyphomonas sp.]
MEYFSAAPVTSSVLLANIIASMIGFASPDFVTQNAFWIRPIREQRQWHRVITSGFLHVATWHLFANMITLYYFGPWLEHVFGATGFLILYFGSLLGGSMWDVVDKRNKPDYRAVGASGAISGLMSAVGIIFPFLTIGIFGILPVWAGAYAVIFIVISYGLSKREDAIIGHGAHLGGALAGIVITLLLRPESFSELIQQISEKFG